MKVGRRRRQRRGRKRWGVGIQCASHGWGQVEEMGVKGETSRL